MAVDVTPPKRLLLCLGPCYGEFYYPLAEGERVSCPTDGTHPVAVYAHIATVAEPDEDDEAVPFDPDWCIAPGATLREWREEHGLTQHEAAQRCWLAPPTYEAIEDGTMAISTELALQLALGTGTTSAFWLTREQHYRDGLAAGKKDTT